MFDTSGTYSFYGMESYPIVKPNIRTGEGRMKGRGYAVTGFPDLSAESVRANRGRTGTGEAIL